MGNTLEQTAPTEFVSQARPEFPVWYPLPRPDNAFRINLESRYANHILE